MVAVVRLGVGLDVWGERRRATGLALAQGRSDTCYNRKGGVRGGPVAAVKAGR